MSYLRPFVTLFAVLLAVLFARLASAAETRSTETKECEHCNHAKSHAEAGAPHFQRSVRRYDLPAVTLVDQDGRRVPLAEALAPGSAVAVDFVFTTCTTICPVLSATFSGLRRELGDEARSVRLVSISIDPEYDRPEVLKAYAKRYGADADANWSFYTGNVEDIRTVLAAFGVLAGDKMEHRPVTLLRRATGGEWIRIDGFARPADLAHELHELHAGR